MQAGYITLYRFRISFIRFPLLNIQIALFRFTLFFSAAIFASSKQNN